MWDFPGRPSRRERFAFDATPEFLFFWFGLVLVGLGLLLFLIALFSTSTVRHIDIRPRGGSPPYFVEIDRGLRDPLVLRAREGAPTAGAVRWPVPRTVPAQDTVTIRLFVAGTNHVLDEVNVSGSSHVSRRFEYELHRTPSFILALDRFVRMPLGQIYGVVLCVFLVVGFAVSKDAWWFLRWWTHSH